MVRGKILFKCTGCGKRFWDLDIEYMATIYSVPQRCPYCHSFRTRPSRWMSLTSYNSIYEKIWADMEKNG